MPWWRFNLFNISIIYKCFCFSKVERGSIVTFLSNWISKCTICLLKNGNNWLSTCWFYKLSYSVMGCKILYDYNMTSVDLSNRSTEISSQHCPGTLLGSTGCLKTLLVNIWQWKQLFTNSETFYSKFLIKKLLLNLWIKPFCPGCAPLCASLIAFV